jgi:hypothetical protein
LIEQHFQSLLDAVAGSPIVHSSNVLLDKRTSRTGLIRGELVFTDGSALFFRELIEAQTGLLRHMYSYHHQKADGTLIFRYDDTPHFPGLPGFPHHKHTGHEASATPAPPTNLAAVLREIEASYNISGRR